MCKANFPRKDSLDKHILKVHEKKKLFKCDNCDYSCYRKSTMNNHILSVHEKLRNFKWHLCENAYLDAGALNFHLERHKTPEEEQVQCNICPEMVRRINFKRHQETHKEKQKQRNKFLGNTELNVILLLWQDLYTYFVQPQCMIVQCSNQLPGLVQL